MGPSRDRGSPSKATSPPADEEAGEMRPPIAFAMPVLALTCSTDLRQLKYDGLVSLAWTWEAYRTDLVGLLRALPLLLPEVRKGCGFTGVVLDDIGVGY